MSRPSLLLVDDSEAVLAYETAALSVLYETAVARSGDDALQMLERMHFDAVLLDLSMPGKSGEEVLRIMREDHRWRDVPVVVVSGEHRRAEALIGAGAHAVVKKPIVAETLREVIGQVLEDQKRAQDVGSLAGVIVDVGSLAFGIPLRAVVEILLQPATVPLPIGPRYLRRMLDLRGEPVGVLDIAERLGVRPGVRYVERKLVIVSERAQRLAISVDRVSDPEIFLRDRVVRPEALGMSGHSPLDEALSAVVRHEVRGLLPFVEPLALLSPRVLRWLPVALERVRSAGVVA